MMTDATLQREAEIAACKLSKRWLFERHYVIQDKEGAVRLMSPLKLAQRKLHAVLEWCRANDKPAWILVGKSRKEGISTYVAAHALDEYIARDIEVMVIAHEKRSSEYILGIYKRFYEYLNRQMDDAIAPITKPPLHKGTTNKYEIRLEEYNGLIVIDTANNENAGRSRTPHIIHCSEAAFFDKGPVLAEALFQSMSSKPGTTFIMESTFNGEDALFWPMWQKAYDNSHLTFSEAKGGELVADFSITNETDWNGWIPLFISVLDDEDAWEHFDSDDARDKFATTLDDYEQHLVDTTDASLEYLNWRRMQIKQVCLGNIDKYKRGYPATVTEALVATKRSRFNYDALDRMPIEQPEKGELYHADTWDKRTRFRRDSSGLLYRYKDVQSGHRYVAGCDPAEGKLDDFGANPDASVIHIYDCDAGMEQVAAYYGQVSEENLVTPLHMICCYYNNTFCVIESNSTGKHVCIEMAKIYPSELLYHRDDWNPERSRASREVGHRTHVGNKNILIGGLAEAIETGQIIFRDAKTVRECKTYEYKEGGGTAARGGHHDDQVMAAALGVIGAKAFTALKRLNTQQTSYFKQWKESDTRETANAVTGY